MPFKTEFQRPFPGATWLEPVQVWVEPTPEQVAAEEAHRAEGERLRVAQEQLLADMRAVRLGEPHVP
jgi:hypothetical protein